MQRSQDLEFAHVLGPGGRRTKQFLKLSLPDFRNHVLLVGGSGSGKTHFTKALLEEIILKGIPVVAVDSQGDLLWLTQPRIGRTQSKKKLRELQKRVFTPNSAVGDPFVIAPVLSSGRSEINRQMIGYWIGSVMRNIGYELKPGQTSPQEYQLTKASDRILLSGGKLSLDALFRAASGEVLKWTTDRMAPIAPEDAWELVSRLGALLGNYESLYKGKGFDIGKLTKSRIGGLWIIYSAHLAIETRQIVLNWVCDSVYHWMMSQRLPRHGNRPNLILFIDEAADYVTKSNRLEHRQSLFRLLNQGRKYGVGLILAVQTPRALAPEVLNNCAIKVFGAVDDPGDLQSVMYSTGCVEKELKPIWNRSWKNTFVVRLPGADEAVFCKARNLLTRKGEPIRLDSSRMISIVKLLKHV